MQAGRLRVRHKPDLWTPLIYSVVLNDFSFLKQFFSMSNNLITQNNNREMLINVLRALVYELFLKIFYEKNDKIINFFDSFLYLS